MFNYMIDEEKERINRLCLRPLKPLCILSLLMNTILHIDPLEIEEARCFNLLIQVHGLLTDVALITLLFRLLFFLFYVFSFFSIDSFEVLNITLKERRKESVLLVFMVLSYTFQFFNTYVCLSI